MSEVPPGFTGVLETCLYHGPDEAEAVTRFYGDLLGLERVAAWPGGVAYRTGPGVLLLFDREALGARDGPVSAHGTAGPGHACLVATPGDYERWRRRLADAGVEITHEHRWEGGLRSLYFADPAGNLLEVAEGDLWPAATAAG